MSQQQLATLMCWSKYILSRKSVCLTKNDLNSEVPGNGGWSNCLSHIYGVLSQPKTVAVDFLVDGTNA